MRDERQYLVEAIQSFLDGSGAKWDWDDFTSCTLRSAKLNALRRQAARVDLPIDADGEATLRRLIDQAERLSAEGLEKRKPWRIAIGVWIGLAAGIVIWWMRYLPGGGFFQNIELVVVPVALGALVVTLRNRREEVGYYDPENIEQNKQGRV